MSHSRLPVVLTIVLAAVASVPCGHSRGQETQKSDAGHAAAVQRIQGLLDKQVIDASDFQTEMPLVKLLAAILQRLPQDAQVALRIDGEAVGKEFLDALAMPMALPPVPKKTSLRRVLELAIAKCKTRIDYRIGAAEVVLTTPERALDTIVYDIRDLGAIPGDRAIDLLGQNTRLKEAPGATRIVEAIFLALEPAGAWPAPGDQGAVQILNGTRLVIRTNAARHAQIAQLLEAFRRVADVAVIVNSRLYEVDDAYYKRLRGVKHADLEEQERQFLKGTPLDDSLFKQLAKQKLLQAGEDLKVADGGKGRLLSRQHAVSCLPSPEQIRRGDRTRQTIVEGIAFDGTFHVTSDRRFVHFKLFEKAAELEQILKLKAWEPESNGGTAKEPKQVDAEVGFVTESVHTRTLGAPDGGTFLIPVLHRPAVMAAQGRWWVLSITPRIYIEAEEQELRKK